MKRLLQGALFAFLAIIILTALFPALWHLLKALIILILVLLGILIISIALLIWRIRRQINDPNRSDLFSTFTFTQTGQPTQDYDENPAGRKDVTPPDEELK
jgi:hypothetical protein